MSTFGSRLKLLRSLRGLTQEKLAESLNEMFSTSINKSMISKWENDKEDASMTNVRLIAKYFDIKLDNLLDIDFNNNLHQAIKAERIRLTLDIKEVAEYSGISETDLILYEEGLKELPDIVVDKIASFLGSDVPDLLVAYDLYDEEIPDIFNGDLRAYLEFQAAERQDALSNKDHYDLSKIDNIYKIEKKKFPLLGDVACGKPALANEDFEGYIEAGANIHADFCLKAKGNSMVNARILDGDIVFIRKQDIVDNGEIAAILIDDEATLKRFYMTNDMIQLIAENPLFPPLIFKREDLDGIRILGKAIAFQSNVL